MSIFRAYKQELRTIKLSWQWNNYKGEKIQHSQGNLMKLSIQVDHRKLKDPSFLRTHYCFYGVTTPLKHVFPKISGTTWNKYCNILDTKGCISKALISLGEMRHKLLLFFYLPAKTFHPRWQFFLHVSWVKN